MPAALPKPPKEILYQLYVIERKSFREIMKILNFNANRAVRKWLIEYEIPIRTGGEAVKTQWENNDERRKTQAELNRKLFTGNTNRRLCDSVIDEKLRKKNLKLIERKIINGYTVALAECLVCSHQFSRHSKNINYDGCPNCRVSKGESRIKEVLDSFGFAYVREYKFEDCQLQRKLPFDFAVFNENGRLICLIEYDGEFHFGKVIKSASKTNFSQVLLRDKIKTDYCKRKRIKLIRISFLNFDNIEQILANNLLKQPSLF